jgi:hypothetical protein
VLVPPLAQVQLPLLVLVLSQRSVLLQAQVQPTRSAFRWRLRKARQRVQAR